jgi:hypothetical protein
MRSRLHLLAVPDGSPRPAILASADQKEREVALRLFPIGLRGRETIDARRQRLAQPLPRAPEPRARSSSRLTNCGRSSSRRPAAIRKVPNSPFARRLRASGAKPAPRPGELPFTAGRVMSDEKPG